MKRMELVWRPLFFHEFLHSFTIWLLKCVESNSVGIKSALIFW